MKPDDRARLLAGEIIPISSPNMKAAQMMACRWSKGVSFRVSAAMVDGKFYLRKRPDLVMRALPKPPIKPKTPGVSWPW